MSRPDTKGAAESPHAFRYGKAYTVRQAARFAAVAPATVRRWLAGYDVPEHQMTRVFDSGRGADERTEISFLQLIEIVVVAQFRRGKRPIPLDRLRRAHTFACDRFKLSYPFASLRMRESGSQILHEFDKAHPHGPALALDIGGQWVLPGSVTIVLGQVDFSKADQLAERWFPAGREAPLVLDPRIGAGRVTVLGTGVTVNTIHNRFLAGDSIEFLASDYDLAEATIEEAIRYADRSDLAAA
jgi:uncharacterized protein (DUF433 family)